MNMNMCIIMTMNIYISKDNEKWLRTQDASMSGIINKLLNDARKVPKPEVPKPDRKIGEYATETTLPDGARAIVIESKIKPKSKKVPEPVEDGWTGPLFKTGGKL